jgi:GcrA cell cycle regulator
MNMETQKMDWSEERIAELGRLWAEGLSASKIAGQLGGVSRNAVIGKVHRLGLPGRKTASRASKAKPSNKSCQTAPARSARLVSAVQGALALKPVAAPEPRPKPRLVIVPEPEPELELELEIAAGVTLLDLDEDMCRWPEGDPKAPDFHFCGQPSVESQSYCARHLGIAFSSRGRCRCSK